MINKNSPYNFEERMVVFLGKAVDFASRSTQWPRPLKRLAVAGVDALLAVIAVWLAFSLRLGELHVPGSALALFTGTMLGLWFPIALSQGVYRTIFRFSGRGAIVAIMVAVAITTMPLIMAFMALPQTDVPRTIAILGPLIFFLLVTE